MFEFGIKDAIDILLVAMLLFYAWRLMKSSGSLNVFYGIMVSILAPTGIFHPYALAMACGTGSASMMSASLGAVVDAFPEMETELTAYAATSNMLSSVDGLYMSLFIAVPMCEWMYKKFTANNKNYKDGKPIAKEKKAA